MSRFSGALLLMALLPAAFVALIGGRGPEPATSAREPVSASDQPDAEPVGLAAVEGRSEAARRLPDLAPSETEVEAEPDQSTTTDHTQIRGVVLNDRGPAADIEVELYRRAASPRYVDWWRIWGAPNRQARRLGSTETDATGRFVLAVPEGGPLTVRAIASSGRHALVEIDLTPGKGVDGVTLHLPRPAVISGRILAPLQADLGKLVVRAGEWSGVETVEPSQWMRGWDAYVETEVAEDGSYRIEPVPLGDVRLAIVGPGTFNTLADIKLQIDAPGPYGQDFDLLETWPAQALVTITAGGRGYRGAMVRVDRRKNDGWTKQAEDRTNSEGIAKVRLAPATEYRVTVQVEPGGWSWTDPQTFTLDPAQTMERLISVPFPAQLPAQPHEHARH